MINVKLEARQANRGTQLRGTLERAGSWSVVYRHVKVVAPSEPIKARSLLALFTK